MSNGWVFILKEMSKRDFDKHEIDIVHCVDGDGRNSLRLSVDGKIIVTKGFETPSVETEYVISAKPILFLLQIANQTGFSIEYIYREMQNIFSVPKYTYEAQHYSFNISDAIQKSVYDALLSSGCIEKKGKMVHFIVLI